MTITWYCLHCNQPLNPPNITRLCSDCARGEDK